MYLRTRYERSPGKPTTSEVGVAQQRYKFADGERRDERRIGFVLLKHMCCNRRLHLTSWLVSNQSRFEENLDGKSVPY